MNKRISELADQAIRWAFIQNCKTERQRKDIEKQKFAELIIKECIAQCKEVASEANLVAKSTFVTDAGKILHEGMWGGASNCAASIKEHFGLE